MEKESWKVCELPKRECKETCRECCWDLSVPENDERALREFGNASEGRFGRGENAIDVSFFCDCRDPQEKKFSE